MKHYSLDKWANFARGVIDERERAAMQNHLDEGCTMCEEAVALWKRVQTIFAGLDTGVGV